MTVASPQVRRVVGDDWQELRRVRLAAMSDSPEAFGSSYERELAFDEAGWRERIARSPWWLAWAEGGAVGIIAAFLADPEEKPDDRHVVSMWVAPPARGAGVADALMAELASWAIGDGASTLSLWVVEENERAKAFYRRHGFAATSRKAPLPSNTALTEIYMVRDLAGSDDS